MSSFRLRISNARQIVQVCANHEKFKAGKAQDELAVIAHGALVVDHVGKIAAVGTDEHVAQWLQTQPQPVHFDEEIDGSEFCILPGFVDGHTHPVWSGNRVGEFAMKLAGATYMEVGSCFLLLLWALCWLSTVALMGLCVALLCAGP
jgi:imidazolonepropionase